MPELDVAIARAAFLVGEAGGRDDVVRGELVPVPVKRNTYKSEI